jgi:hypothetical protein
MWLQKKEDIMKLVKEIPKIVLYRAPLHFINDYWYIMTLYDEDFTKMGGGAMTHTVLHGKYKPSIKHIGRNLAVLFKDGCFYADDDTPEEKLLKAGGKV